MDFAENIKAVPIIDFASRIGFTVVRKGRYYSLREHDSVIIDAEKNCFWRNSKFSKGYRGGAGSIIDFAIEFNEAEDHKKAMRQIAVIYGIEGEQEAKVSYRTDHQTANVRGSKPIREKGDVDFPKKADNNKAAYRYLIKERGIEESVVRYFMAKGMLYQDDHKNCVFATEKFACVRGTNTEKRFVRDCDGCDYDECFFFKGHENASTLIVTESVIDVMSIMSLYAKENIRFSNFAYLALSGTNKLSSLFYHLDREVGIKKVVLGFDNDEAGERAYKMAEEGLAEYNVQCMKAFPPSKKDWNEYLCWKNKKTISETENS